MQSSLMDRYIKQILARLQADGGFQFSPKGGSRPDATAWAIFYLENSGFGPDFLNRSRDYLVRYQLEDGRVSIDLEHPEAFWLTPLAIFAWQDSAVHERFYNKAVQFILNSSGEHWPKQPNSPLKHDPEIRGWPWIDHTHSWVPSTAINLMALYHAGKSHHPRVKEATSLLLDRQLPHGGWNYGNTEVFGQELRPSPEDTGAALTALVGQTSETHVSKSLEYLLNQVEILRTPIALGWTLIGLSSWDKRPPDMKIQILDTFERGNRFGEYDTPSLCLLLIANDATRGLHRLIRERHRSPSIR